MIAFQMGSLEVPARATPIPKGKIKVINYDPHGLWKKGLDPFTTEKQEVLWVHLNILKDE